MGWYLINRYTFSDRSLVIEHAIDAVKAKCSKRALLFVANRIALKPGQHLQAEPCITRDDINRAIRTCLNAAKMRFEFEQLMSY